MTAGLAIVVLAALKVESATLNAGGHPLQGTKLGSASYRVSLDALGDSARSGLTSASFRLDGGFVARYPPPGEVKNLRFTTKSQLVWNGERSTGTYDVYRAVLSTLPGSFGGCLASGIQPTSYDDVAIPSPATGLFYLVTAENRLLEEGTKGPSSNGVPRSNTSACP